MRKNYNNLRRVPLDPRAIEKIQKSPVMMKEQEGAPLWNTWGSPSQYRFYASLPLEERLVYDAVTSGCETESEIRDVTGLGSKEVDMGLRGLQMRGVVTRG